MRCCRCSRTVDPRVLWQGRTLRMLSDQKANPGGRLARQKSRYCCATTLRGLWVGGAGVRSQKLMLRASSRGLKVKLYWPGANYQVVDVDGGRIGL